MNNAPIVHPALAQASFERAIQPLLSRPQNYAAAGLKLVAYQFPFLDVELDWYRHGTTIILRVDGTDYPYRPVSGWWIAPDGRPLSNGDPGIPSGMGFHTAGIESEPRCWFCFPGWKEYHNHSGHQDRSWAFLRPDKRYTVLGLIQQLATDLNSVGVHRS
jgi:hypothetical protein